MSNFFQLTSGDSVKVNDGTDQALITSNGEVLVADLPTIATQGTQIGRFAGAGASTYTVPASSVLYIVAMSGRAGYNSYVTLLDTDGTTTLFYANNTSTATTCFTLGTTFIKLTAGQKVTYNAYASFIGYLIAV